MQLRGNRIYFIDLIDCDENRFMFLFHNLAQNSSAVLGNRQQSNAFFACSRVMKRHKLFCGTVWRKVQVFFLRLANILIPKQYTKSYESKHDGNLTENAGITQLVRQHQWKEKQSTFQIWNPSSEQGLNFPLIEMSVFACQCQFSKKLLLYVESFEIFCHVVQHCGTNVTNYKEACAAFIQALVPSRIGYKKLILYHG